MEYGGHAHAHCDAERQLPPSAETFVAPADRLQQKSSAVEIYGDNQNPPFSNPRDRGNWLRV